MKDKPIPMVSQHESWISLDLIQGCPAGCVYCYLGPPGLTKRVPGEPIAAPETAYQTLSNYEYFEKSRFSDVPAGRSFPIAIGNYTDMCLTAKNRELLLLLLAKHKQHMPETPICIVTKALLDHKFLAALDQIGITIIFFISLSFLPTTLERGTPSTNARITNFGGIAQFANLHAVHFWRPATSKSVPDRQTALHQVELLQNAGAKASVITGLKFGNNLAETFGTNEQHAFHEFFKTRRADNHLKNEIFEPEVQEAILSAAQELSYPVYLHTSCAVSYVLQQPDYNATFRRPHLETKCQVSTCPSAQRERCFHFKTRLPFPSKVLQEQVARYLGLPISAVTYSERRDTIFVDCSLTQEEQTYLTQATSFPVRARSLVPTLEWIGSINR